MLQHRRGALHGGRLDTDGDGSDAVADASVTLATASDLLTTQSNVGRAAQTRVRLTVSTRHARSTCHTPYRK